MPSPRSVAAGETRRNEIHHISFSIDQLRRSLIVECHGAPLSPRRAATNAHSKWCGGFRRAHVPTKTRPESTATPQRLGVSERFGPGFSPIDAHLEERTEALLLGLVRRRFALYCVLRPIDGFSGFFFDIVGCS